MLIPLIVRERAVKDTCAEQYNELMHKIKEYDVCFSDLVKYYHTSLKQDAKLDELESYLRSLLLAFKEKTGLTLSVSTICYDEDSIHNTVYYELKFEEVYTLTEQGEAFGKHNFYIDNPFEHF